MKAVRSMEIGMYGLRLKNADAWTPMEIEDKIKTPNDERLFVIAEAFRRGMMVEEIVELSAIDPWFLHGIKRLVEMEASIRDAGADLRELAESSDVSRMKQNRTVKLLREAKQFGFPDKVIAELAGAEEDKVREFRKALGILPTYKMVDTCAAEFEAQTPYFYSCYEDDDEAEFFVPQESGVRSQESESGIRNPASTINHEPSTIPRKKAIVIGSGPIRIGQGIEFDYCSVHSVWALREAGYESIIINNNPETVSHRLRHLRQALLRAADRRGRAEHHRHREARRRDRPVRRPDRHQPRRAAPQGGRPDPRHVASSRSTIAEDRDKFEHICCESSTSRSRPDERSPIRRTPWRSRRRSATRCSCGRLRARRSRDGDRLQHRGAALAI